MGGRRRQGRKGAKKSEGDREGEGTTEQNAKEGKSDGEGEERINGRSRGKEPKKSRTKVTGKEKKVGRDQRNPKKKKTPKTKQRLPANPTKNFRATSGNWQAKKSNAKANKQRRQSASCHVFVGPGKEAKQGVKTVVRMQCRRPMRGQWRGWIGRSTGAPGRNNTATLGDKGKTRRYKSVGDVTKQEGEAEHGDRRRAGATKRVHDDVQTVREQMGRKLRPDGAYHL